MSSAHARPRHLISDKGTQFWNRGFKQWCKRRKIRPRYGAVGKYGSIAIIERFIRSMKSECTRQILVPLNFNDMREELVLYVTWYNEFRPHQAQDGRTPQEVYTSTRTNAPPLQIVPNSQLPEMRLAVFHLEGRKHLPIVEVKKAA